MFLECFYFGPGRRYRTVIDFDIFIGDIRSRYYASNCQSDR